MIADQTKRILGAPCSPVWAGSLLDRLKLNVPGAHNGPIASSQNLSLTANDLHLLSDSLASSILQRTNGDTGVISVYAERCPLLTVSLLAIIKAGCIFHIIDPKHPRKRIAECISYVRPRGIIYTQLPPDSSYSPDLLPELPPSSFRLRADALLGSPSKSYGGESFRGPRGADLSFDTPMYVAFTSGTTGLPKAVWGSHGPVAHFFSWQSENFRIGASDRVSVLSGLSHDPLLRDVLMPVWAGCCSCFPPADVYSVPGALYRWLRDSRITVVHVTPSLCQLLLSLPSSGEGCILPDLRLAFFGGEALPVKLVERFRVLAPHAQVVNFYGSTETPQVMAFHIALSPGQSKERPPPSDTGQVPIGKGIDGVQLLVLDEGRQLLPPGATGEIFIRTPYRAQRVEDISGKASDNFIPNPYSSSPQDLLYRTGDFGQYLPDGSVVYTGRRDRQVKIRGFRVDLSEVEQAVQGCVGVSHFHLDTGEQGSPTRLTLFVVPDAGSAIETEALRIALARILPGYMIPEQVIKLPSMPRTPNGKIDRDALRKLINNDNPPSSSAKSQDVLSHSSTIADRLRALSLPLLEDGRTFALMDSLKLVEVSCLIEREFGVLLSVGELQRHRSLESLSKRICSTTSETSSATRTDVAISGTRVHAANIEEAGARPVDSHDHAHKHRWLPRNEALGTAVLNRIFQVVARVAPDSLRVRLHRWRGVHIGHDVSIGYDSIIETAYPWLVRIGDRANLGMRVTVIAHFRGMGALDRTRPTVVVDDGAFVGPGVLILPNVIIGTGAVIAAGSVVTSSIPPHTFAQGNPARVIARCGVPLSGDTTYAEFLSNLVPLRTMREDSGNVGDVSRDDS